MNLSTAAATTTTTTTAAASVSSQSSRTNNHNHSHFHAGRRRTPTNNNTNKNSYEFRHHHHQQQQPNYRPVTKTASPTAAMTTTSTRASTTMIAGSRLVVGIAMILFVCLSLSRYSFLILSSSSSSSSTLSLYSAATASTSSSSSSLELFDEESRHPLFRKSSHPRVLEEAAAAAAAAAAGSSTAAAAAGEVSKASASAATTPIRYIAFGSIETWGEGLEQKQHSSSSSSLPQKQLLHSTYPYQLHKHYHWRTRNAATKTSDVFLAAACTQSIVGDEDMYDVISIEFETTRSFGDSHARLARRLRTRFPKALILLVQVWKPSHIVFRTTTTTTSSYSDATTPTNPTNSTNNSSSSSNNNNTTIWMTLDEWRESRNLLSPTVSLHSSELALEMMEAGPENWSVSLQDAADNEDDSSSSLALLQQTLLDVQATLFTLPTPDFKSFSFPTNLRGFLSMFQPEAPYHLNAKGHTLLAQGIEQEVTKQVRQNQQQQRQQQIHHTKQQEQQHQQQLHQQLQQQLQQEQEHKQQRKQEKQQRKLELRQQPRQPKQEKLLKEKKQKQALKQVHNHHQQQKQQEQARTALLEQSQQQQQLHDPRRKLQQQTITTATTTTKTTKSDVTRSNKIDNNNNILGTWGSGDFCNIWYHTGQIATPTTTTASTTATSSASSTSTTASALTSLLTASAAASGNIFIGAQPVDFSYTTTSSTSTSSSSSHDDFYGTFGSGGATHKHALEFPSFQGSKRSSSSNGSSNSGSLLVDNPFSTERMLYLTYMTASDNYDYDNTREEYSKVYPRTRVRLNGRPLIVIDPYHDFSNSNDDDYGYYGNSKNLNNHLSVDHLHQHQQQKHLHNNDDHLPRTTAVGMIPPGQTVVQLDSLEHSQLRFRLVGFSLLAEDLSDYPNIDFALEPEPAKRDRSLLERLW